MREVSLNDVLMRVKEQSKPVRRRPVPEWKLLNSIRFIRMRDRHLREIGTLTRIGKRTWRLR